MTTASAPATAAWFACTSGPGTCATYSSGALRYAIALITAAKVDLDYLAALDDIVPSGSG
jgi:hypothetical protein